MIPASPTPAAAHKRSGTAVLFLNDQEVGTVHAHGGDTSWGFGEFSPNDTFSFYAPLFGAWSVLMHAEDDSDRLSREAAIELAKAEETLAALRARLFFPQDQQHIRIAELTIDGDKLEWKEY
jgi:hypothetical protein